MTHIVGASAHTRVLACRLVARTTRDRRVIALCDLRRFGEETPACRSLTLSLPPLTLEKVPLALLDWPPDTALYPLVATWVPVINSRRQRDSPYQETAYVIMAATDVRAISRSLVVRATSYRRQQARGVVLLAKHHVVLVRRLIPKARYQTIRALRFILRADDEVVPAGSDMVAAGRVLLEHDVA